MGDFFMTDNLHDATMRQQLITIRTQSGQDHELNPESWLTKEDEGCSYQPS